jgi:hypothetical protein
MVLSSPTGVSPLLLYRVLTSALGEGATILGSQPLLFEKCFTLAAVRWFDQLVRRGPRPRNMSGDNAQPSLDDRTRALISSLIETGIESAIAARPATLLGDGDGAAVQRPSAEPAADSGRAEIRPRAGGTAEVQGGDAPRDDDGPSEAGGAEEEEYAGE